MNKAHRGLFVILINVVILTAIFIIMTVGNNSGNLSPQTFQTGVKETESKAGEVLVEVDKHEYKYDEEIVVTIRNNLDTNIATYDQRAYCSIVKLEQRSGTEWKEVRNCFSLAPPSIVSLAPYSETTVKLPIYQQSGVDISPGIYRVTMEFSPGETFNFENLIVVSSPSFELQ